MPLDDLQNFNSGYRVLNGDFPFKDYYSISGPLLDIFQSFFYKLFGINWNSFISEVFYQFLKNSGASHIPVIKIRDKLFYQTKFEKNVISNVII